MSFDIMSIGGGDVGSGQTLAIDREFIARTGKPNPLVLFIPTACSDANDYYEAFRTAYERLGCQTQVLLLIDDPDPEAAQKIQNADAIYVGGGNTKMMLEIWKRTGVDHLLQEVASNGKPVGGLSAGAICWYRLGNSDWPQYEGIPGVNTAPLDGLGFVDLSICPHTKNEGFRLAEFQEMLRDVPGPGIGVDDCCAFHVLGDQYRVIASEDGAVAHRIEWVDGQPCHRTLPADRVFRPLDDLRQRG